MRVLADPAEAFAQYGWYLVGAAVLYFYVLRPYVDGEVARRKLAEANDPSRRRALLRGLVEARLPVGDGRGALLVERASSRRVVRLG